MRTWSRAPARTLCGGCAETIQRDAPILKIQLVGLKHVGIRGECCAGPAPPDLPDEIVVTAERPQRVFADFARFSEPDWKQKQSGDA